jgi:hypothetical protein
MDEQIVQAGQVNIVACDLLQANGEDGLELTALVEKITIYEDIFSPFISGEIVLRDTYDIPNTIGRSSRDLLRLVINTPSLAEEKNIDGYFLIYKISDRQLVSDRSTMFTIKFCSEEMIYDVQKRISKTYDGSGNEIIEDIVSSKLGSSKKVTTDDASNEIKFTSNFWSPTQCIRYIIEHSLDQDNNPAYLFFENRQGFNFRSLVKLAEQEDLMQYYTASNFIASVETKTPGTIRFGAAERSPNDDFSIIREIRVDSTFDYLDFMNSGAVRSILYTHDLVTKRIDIQKFDLAEESHEKLNDNRHLSDAVISNTEPLIMTASKHWSSIVDEEDKTNTKFLQKRVSQLAQYQSFRIEIDAFGRTDYTVGGKVYLDLNQIRAISKDEEHDEYIDKLLSGYYLVSKVAHHITRKEHIVTLELIKDSTILK